MPDAPAPDAPLAGAARRRLPLPERGVELALLDFGGDGPLVLLHHANGFCKELWAPVAIRLGARFHVVALDGRGHGESEKPGAPEAYAWSHFASDLAAAAAALAAESGERVALGVGHSFGGTAMLGAAGMRRDLFERLVLVDPVVPPPPSVASEERVARTLELAERARGRRAHFGSREAARATWSEHHFFSGWDPRALELYLAHGLRAAAEGGVTLACPPEVEAAVFLGGLDVDAFAWAAQVTAPTLVLWAEKGQFPIEVMDALSEALLRGRLERFPAGHLAPMERPEELADAIASFASPSGDEP